MYVPVTPKTVSLLPDDVTVCAKHSLQSKHAFTWPSRSTFRDVSRNFLPASQLTHVAPLRMKPALHSLLMP
jgi:hypothetical protein